MVAELDDRSRLEHALRVHRELAVLELVQVRGDEEQVGARLDGQETRSRHVDAVSVLEVCTVRQERVLISGKLGAESIAATKTYA